MWGTKALGKGLELIRTHFDRYSNWLQCNAIEAQQSQPVGGYTARVKLWIIVNALVAKEYFLIFKGQYIDI